MTDKELFDIYLKEEWYEIFSFQAFKASYAQLKKEENKK